MIMDEIEALNSSLDLFCSFNYQLKYSLIKEYYGEEEKNIIAGSGDFDKDWQESKMFLLFIHNKFVNASHK